MYEELLKKRLCSMHERYDSDICLISSIYEEQKKGYHSCMEGYVHPTRDSAEYVSLIFATGDTEYYGRACDVLRSLVSLQDLRKDSNTRGVWPYLFEESLDEMIIPDENWAVFIGKIVAYVLKHHSHNLDNELKVALEQSLDASISSVIRRNISTDYTNISIMSMVFVLAAGEILSNDLYTSMGQDMLDKIVEYNVFNNDFSEFNSSTYTPLVLEDLALLTILVEDKKCREMAKKLSFIGWKELAEHYHVGMMQLAPPNKRAYRDLDDGSLRTFIHIGTEGKYGKVQLSPKVTDSWFWLPIRCPQELYTIFENAERWLETVYYKKNNLRSPDENTIIVRNVDSPDLLAYTYITPDYAMGAFDKTDLWNQRRTSMVIWGKENPTCVRLRCIKDDYDYCSGMAYTAQYKNTFVTNLGFVTDHGDLHYILDKVKDGKLHAERLLFRLEFGGMLDNLQIKQDSNRFLVKVNDMELELTVFSAMFGGKTMEVLFNKEETSIDFICFKEKKEVDFNLLKDCYVAFSLVANGTVIGGTTRVQDTMLLTNVETKECTIKVNSPVDPLTYNEAIETVKTEVSIKAL